MRFNITSYILLIKDCASVCVREERQRKRQRERGVLWTQSSHLTFCHFCLPQLNQHVPALPMHVGGGPAACQEPGFIPPPPPPPLLTGVCVSVGKRPAPLTPVPRYGIQIILLQPHCHPLPPPTGNHALSKQAFGVRGKAISAIGLVLMDCRVCWQVVRWCLWIDQIN